MLLNKIKKYGLLYGAFLIYSGTTICAKYAAQQDMLIKVLVFMGLEVACLGVYAIIWQLLLNTGIFYQLLRPLWQTVFLPALYWNGTIGYNEPHP